MDLAGVIKPFPTTSIKAEFLFDNDLENYPLSEGDLINIKTLVDNPWRENSYFFTFLIELDPL